jgi:hypothetical protein
VHHAKEDQWHILRESGAAGSVNMTFKLPNPYSRVVYRFESHKGPRFRPVALRIEAEYNYMEKAVHEYAEAELYDSLTRFAAALAVADMAGQGSFVVKGVEFSVQGRNRAAYRVAVVLFGKLAPNLHAKDARIARIGGFYEVNTFYVICHDRLQPASDPMLYRVVSEALYHDCESRGAVLVQWSNCSDSAEAWKQFNRDPRQYYSADTVALMSSSRDLATVQ